MSLPCVHYADKSSTADDVPSDGASRRSTACGMPLILVLALQNENYDDDEGYMDDDDGGDGEGIF